MYLQSIIASCIPRPGYVFQNLLAYEPRICIELEPIYVYLISKCQCHAARFVVGQNLYIYKQSRKSAATNWTRSITDWYDEVELFGKERVKPFKFSTDVGNHLKTKICIVKPNFQK